MFALNMLHYTETTINIKLKKLIVQDHSVWKKPDMIINKP